MAGCLVALGEAEAIEAAEEVPESEYHGRLLSEAEFVDNDFKHSYEKSTRNPCSVGQFPNVSRLLCK